MFANSQEEKLLPEVSLVFSPLVTTNFGDYYPSTAVLSSCLKAHGFYTKQTDLNEDFALYLLQPERPKEMATYTQIREYYLNFIKQDNVANWVYG